MVSEPIIADKTPESTMYDLIEVYIQEPTVSPSEENLAHARPYEFDNDRAIKYSATSPHCGCGLDFGPADIVFKFGRRFLSCQCTPRPAPTVIDDPFVNPISSGIISMGDDEVTCVIPAVLQMSANLPESVSDQDPNYDVDSIVDEILKL